MLFHISQEMPLDTDGLFGCCNPVPPLVRANAFEIVGLIRDTKLSPQAPNVHEMELETTPLIYNETPSYTPIEIDKIKIKKENVNAIKTPNDVKYNFNSLTQNYNNNHIEFASPSIKKNKNKKLEVITSHIDDTSTALFKDNEEPIYSSYETAKVIKDSLNTDIFKPKFDFLESNEEVNSLEKK